MARSHCYSQPKVPKLQHGAATVPRNKLTKCSNVAFVCSPNPMYIQIVYVYIYIHMCVCVYECLCAVYER